MSRFTDLFKRLEARGERALIAYLAVGDPDLPTFLAAARAALGSGADALELGVPYSDPLADGPAIQAAGQRALAAGFRLPWLFEALSALRAEFDAPLAVMTYVNPVLQAGARRFVERVRAAGGDALLVPDLPADEAGELSALCREAGLDFVPFVAPTSTRERMAAAAEVGSGFVYCVSVTGVTGARAQLPAELPAFLEEVRRRVPLPRAVGFGVARAEQARALKPHAEGVIVGSALVERVAEGGGAAAVAARVGTHTASLKAALRGDP
ncbi:MAG: tryptophan synthase subunit alpha [Firmicutes bacterium]|nr:tryptophan synthase subunit alpha [Bacillota bacterium]